MLNYKEGKKKKDSDDVGKWRLSYFIHITPFEEKLRILTAPTISDAFSASPALKGFHN